MPRGREYLPCVRLYSSGCRAGIVDRNPWQWQDQTEKLVTSPGVPTDRKLQPISQEETLKLNILIH